MCALWRIHPSNLYIPVQHNWSWSVSFHQNVHQFSGGRDCRQDHKYLLKGCFVCERFKYWQVSKTCIIWIVHGKLSQLLLRKSPGRLWRPLIKPTLVFKEIFSQIQHNFHEQKEKSQESGSCVWRVSVSHKNNHPTCTGWEKKASICYILYWHKEKLPFFCNLHF